MIGTANDFSFNLEPKTKPILEFSKEKRYFEFCLSSQNTAKLDEIDWTKKAEIKTVKSDFASLFQASELIGCSLTSVWPRSSANRLPVESRKKTLVTVDRVDAV